MKKANKQSTKKNAVRTRPKKVIPGASTSQILSNAAPVAVRSAAPKIPVKWSRNYRNLIELRDHILSQMGQLAKDATEETPSFSMHMADSGTDTFDRDFALSMLSSGQDSLYEIEQAIKRIETGAYGTCEVTGKKIPKERLDAIPWTRFSVEAQKQIEKNQGRGRAHFGELGSVQRQAATESEAADDDEE